MSSTAALIKSIECINSTPFFTMMNPKDIGVSLFGTDINPTVSEAESLSLKESIANNGIQVPLTVGRIRGKGKFHVVKGTRRHGIALGLGLEMVPVEQKDYASLNEMRQDAIADNLERRQLSTTARARLANELWKTYETANDKKEMAAQGYSPRKRAAISGSISEGSLAKLRYVLDSELPDVIQRMLSEELSIDAAHREAQKEIEGVGVSMEKDASTKLMNFMGDLDTVIALNKNLAALFTRVKAGVEALPKRSATDRARALKKMKKARKSLEEATESGILCGLLRTIGVGELDAGSTISGAAIPATQNPTNVPRGNEEEDNG